MEGVDSGVKFWNKNFLGSAKFTIFPSVRRPYSEG